MSRFLRVKFPDSFHFQVPILVKYLKVLFFGFSFQGTPVTEFALLHHVKL